MPTCKVYLENSNVIYYPGNEVKGKFECNCDEDTAIRGIKVRLKCKEYVGNFKIEQFLDPRDNQWKSHYVPTAAGFDVFSLEQLVFAPSDDTIRKGHYEFPFSFTLPEGIPSSFNHEECCVCYKIKGIIDIPFAVDDVDECRFFVTSPTDFNKMSLSLQQPRTYTARRNPMFWLCQCGNPSVKVQLPKIAFTLGETIPFTAHVNNMADREVESLKFKLTRKLYVTKVYQKNKPTYRFKDDIVSTVKDGVASRSEKSYNLAFDIPEDHHVANFARCNYLKVQYLFTVFCEMTTCVMNVGFCETGIMIGHVRWNPQTAIHPSNDNEWRPLLHEELSQPTSYTTQL